MTRRAWYVLDAIARLVQAFTTEVVPVDHPSREIGCSTFPADLFGELWPDNPADLPGFVRELGLEPGVDLPSPEDVVNYVYAGLMGRVYEFGTESSELWGERRRSGVRPDLGEIARDVVYEAQIPRRESPLDATTLAALVESGRSITVTIPGDVGQMLPLGAGLILSGGGLFLYYVGRPFLRGFGGPMEQLGRSAGEAAERAIRGAVSSVLERVRRKPHELDADEARELESGEPRQLEPGDDPDNE